MRQDGSVTGVHPHLLRYLQLAIATLARHALFER